jgi:hypothetical protein
MIYFTSPTIYPWKEVVPHYPLDRMLDEPKIGCGLFRGQKSYIASKQLLFAL